MPNNSYRIRTTVGGDESVVRVNLKQGVKTLNILSLEINPVDEYDKQTSDYGVIVGRVLANDAFGIPNVKVSVFVPISPEDENDYIISNEYPFKTPQSRDNDGVKYNLVTKRSGGPGTFPNKTMVLDNNGSVEVFDKYWKYTAVTNESGDYMIFGVPTGTCQVHYDCDLSDIGILSQHPYDLIAKGYDPNLFKSKYRFTDEDLSHAVHIISQDKTVYVYPFWGDKDANKIGITRNDININYKFEPSCVFMGSSITDPSGTYIGTEGQPNGANGRFDSLSTSMGDIEMIRQRQDGTVEEVTENVTGIIDGNGVWCYQIPMNLDRIGTDEYGNIVRVNDPNKGIPTRARVRFRISLTETDDSSHSEFTAKMLVPCNIPFTRNGDSYAIVDKSKINEDDLKNYYEFGSRTPDCCFTDLYWGKVYSIKQYIPRFQYEYSPKSVGYGDPKIEASKFMGSGEDEPIHQFKDYDYVGKGSDNEEDIEAEKAMYDYSGFPPQYSFKMSCISSIDNIAGLNTFPYNTMYAGVESHIDYKVAYWFYYHLTDESGDARMTSRGLHFCFENDWINGCLYFPRVMIKRLSETDYQYFGDVNDTGNDVYHNIYISGRHQNKWGSLGLQTPNPNANLSKMRGGKVWEKFHNNRIALMGQLVHRWRATVAQEGEDSDSGGVGLYVFSRCDMPCGIITKKETNLGQNVFYYRGASDGGDIASNRRLYATDIILLGNLEDIYDSLPKLYANLPSTTAKFPPIAPPKSLNESGMTWMGYREQLGMAARDRDDERVDIFGNGPDINKKNIKLGYGPGVYGETTWEEAHHAAEQVQPNPEVDENTTERPQWDYMIKFLNMKYSLFFGIMINRVNDFLSYMPTSFVNLSRICELDVHNDQAFYVEHGNNEDFHTKTIKRKFAVNGIIDHYDITTNENRSDFATMNFSRSSITNSIGYRTEIYKPLKVIGFDGRLNNYTSSIYNGIEKLEDSIDRSYYLFRFNCLNNTNIPPIRYKKHIFGDKKLDYVNDDLFITENSFYFYFGLKNGFSAIDALKSKFIEGMVEDTSDSNIIRVNIEPSGCDKNSVWVMANGLNTPIEWTLLKHNQFYKSGVSASDEFSIRSVKSGAYRIELTDSKNNRHEKNFLVMEQGVDFVAEALINDSTHVPFLSVVSVDGYSDLIITQNGDDVLITIAGYDKKKYKLSFDKHVTGVNENLIHFDTDATSVKASVTLIQIISGEETYCITSYFTFVFIGGGEVDLMINDLSVENIKYWKEYNPGEEGHSEYLNSLSNSLDNIFYNDGFYVWDSTKTAHPDKSIRNYKFSPDESFEYQLSSVSSMCSGVFSNKSMGLKFSKTNFNYRNISISPYYNNTTRSLTPAINWGSPETSEKPQFVSADGDSYYNEDFSFVPHIVGSNYPRSVDWVTFLLSGSNTVGYVNNESLKYTNGENIEYFGLNLFGSQHIYNDNVGKPAKLTSQPQITSDSGLYGKYIPSGINNYYAVRSVDKRLDYQFVIKTPLVLPSGYSLFTNLSNKSFVPGKVKIDLYGGFRLNYDKNSKKINCYDINSDKVITGGPDYNARLYSDVLYEDYSESETSLESYETKERIWGYTSSAQSYNDIVDDTDHVTYEFNNLSGGTCVDFRFQSCSTDFSGGYVSAGETQPIHVSYKTGVEFSHNDGGVYDILYVVTGGTTGGYVEVCGSLSGSSMSLAVLADSESDINTYTDVDTDSVHNGNIYPEWAKYYNQEFPFSTSKPAELSVLVCSATSESSYDVVRAYKLNRVLHTDVDIRYDITKSIVPYFEDGDVTKYYGDYDSNSIISYTPELSNVELSLPKDSFISVPLRRVYSSNIYGTLLRQGLSYNVGCVYYTSAIEVNKNNGTKTASVRLKTPLRDSSGNVSYAANKLKYDSSWHTIGQIQNVSSSTGTIVFDETKVEFSYVHTSANTNEGIFYFEIENGLRYCIKLVFDGAA